MVLHYDCVFYPDPSSFYSPSFCLNSFLLVYSPRHAILLMQGVLNLRGFPFNLMSLPIHNLHSVYSHKSLDPFLYSKHHTPEEERRSIKHPIITKLQKFITKLQKRSSINDRIQIHRIHKQIPFRLILPVRKDSLTGSYPRNIIFHIDTFGELRGRAKLRRRTRIAPKQGEIRLPGLDIRGGDRHQINT